jgi:hypothetical protein
MPHQNPTRDGTPHPAQGQTPDRPPGRQAQLILDNPTPPPGPAGPRARVP